MHFNLTDILSLQEQFGQAYFEFINVPAMSMGVYILQKGDNDLQKPHTEDEVYFVIEGKGKFYQEGKEVDVRKGTILFVPTLAEHYFFSIEEKLTILVFFAPAEYSNKASVNSEIP